jgi:hypothetical protein
MPQLAAHDEAVRDRVMRKPDATLAELQDRADVAEAEQRPILVERPIVCLRERQHPLKLCLLFIEAP